MLRSTLFIENNLLGLLAPVELPARRTGGSGGAIADEWVLSINRMPHWGYS